MGVASSPEIAGVGAAWSLLPYRMLRGPWGKVVMYTTRVSEVEPCTDTAVSTHETMVGRFINKENRHMTRRTNLKRRLVDRHRLQASSTLNSISIVTSSINKRDWSQYE